MVNRQTSSFCTASKRRWTVALIALFASLLMLGGCAPKKKPAPEKPAQPVKRERMKNEGFRTLSLDKATITFYNNTGNKSSLNGSVRICRDSMILISITPFTGVNMEFARVGITKAGITIMDRINKKFFFISFDEAQKELGMEMNYNAFESIFTNRVFIYKNPYLPLISDFVVARQPDQTMLTYSDSKVVEEFYFDSKKQLVGGMISAGSQYSMRWNYADYGLYNSVSFPRKFSLKIAGPGFHKQLSVQYKDVQLDRDRNFELKVPKSYELVPLDDLLNQF